MMKRFGQVLLTSLLFASCGESSNDLAVCGDGNIQNSEACDDGNSVAGDGCGIACTVEPGWSCPPIVGLACTTTCGDAVQAGSEECDDSNAVDGDGCSATCRIEAGVENCTDRSDNDGDELVDCDDSECAGTSACNSEICDNRLDDDGDGDIDCSDADCVDVVPCGEESGSTACEDTVDNDGNGDTDCEDESCAPFCGPGRCGDGVPNAGEQCDEGEANSDVAANACRSDCTLASCGDGVTDDGEDCDPEDTDVRCASDCSFSLLGACTVEDDLFVFEFDEGNATGSARLNVARGTGVGDDRILPLDCVPTSGPDFIGLLDVPESGLWYITATDSGTDVPVALSLHASCDVSSSTLACDPGVARAGRGELLLDLSVVNPMLLSVELYRGQLPANVVLRAFRVDASSGVGGPCGALPGGPACTTGLVCSSDSVCERAAAGVVGEGLACDPSGLLTVCAAGLECGSDSVCVWPPGSGCSSPLVVDVADFVESSSTVRLDLQRLREDYDHGCRTMTSGRVVEIRSARPGWVSVTAQNTEEGGSSGVSSLSARTLCDNAASLQFCLREPPALSLLRLQEWVQVSGDAPSFLFVEGSGTADLALEFVPEIRAGRPCDGAAARGCVGLAGCDGSTCVATDGGTCAMPLNVVDLAGAALTAAPIAFEIPNVGISDARRGGLCGVGGSDVTIEVVAPETGVVAASFLTGYTGLTLDLDVACPGLLEEPVCLSVSGSGDRSVREIAVYAGQRIYVTIDGIRSSQAPVLLMSFGARRDRGETCDPAETCLPGLVCDEGLCRPPRAQRGDACGGDVRCVEGLFCSPIDGVCTDPLGPGSSCDLAGEFVTCPDATVCLYAQGRAACRSVTPTAGQPCAASAPCPEGLLCVGGEPGIGTGVCGTTTPAAGQPCDFSGADCSGGLVCRWYSGQEAGTCLDPDVAAPGPYCDLAAPSDTCATGECTRIVEGSSVGACVRSSGPAGATCVAMTASCEAGLECNVPAPVLVGVCTAVEVEVGAPCAPATPTVCPFPLSCRRLEVGGAYTCQEPGFPGDSCVVNRVEDACISASFCAATGSTGDGLCELPSTRPALGEACATNYFCEDGLQCMPSSRVNGFPVETARCLPPLLEGDACTANELEGLCDLYLRCEAPSGGGPSVCVPDE